MTRPRKWSEDDLRKAAKTSRSIRQTIQKLGLIEAGGNYVQIKYYLEQFKIDISHFTGKGWNTDLGFQPFTITPLKSLLVKNSRFQSHKLKKRLFVSGLKKPLCEMCGWSKQSEDGRIPVELDHINGDRMDNRLKNLRILCPNCHSLQLTHRGKNKKVR